MKEQTLRRKYLLRSPTWLKNKADEVFNAWARGKGYFCISCSKPSNQLQAGHFYSAGNYPRLRHEENNVWPQCLKCNFHLHGNLIEYRRMLIAKIGLKEVEKLDIIAQSSKRQTFKWDRFALIETIIKYK